MFPPLLTVVGPTGSGKSALAVALARHFDGELINCDSLQVFRGFDIGTAKLPLAERLSPPHHLFDICSADQTFTAADFARQVKTLLPEISARGRLPILCGGTGFYLRALLRGLSPGPASDLLLRARLEKRSNLPRLLARLDPEAAQRIHPNHRNRILRALEIRILTGRPSHEIFAQASDPLTGYRVLQLGLAPPREVLYSTLNQRSAHMWDDGLVEEARHLLTLYPPSAKPFAALGYKQALDYLAGRTTKEQAIADLQLKTRHYAKRQLTWFRADPEIHWQLDFGTSPQILEQSVIVTERFLSSSV